MRQNLFIVWASWGVWRELVKQVQNLDSKEDNVNPSNIIWVANSSNFIFDGSWIDQAILSSIWWTREESLEIISKEWQKIRDLESFLTLVKSEWLESEVIFVDVTAWKNELRDFHGDVLTNSWNSLVTANKNPISLYSMGDFNELTSQYGRYDTNTTVMWWAGILNFVDSRAKINDNIKMVSWVLSWTLWYILSELERWEKTFSEIVKDAKAEWYTEPNPWDDLNWLDVARKLVILARYAWHLVDIDDVKVTPLINESYWEVDDDDFMEAIKAEDHFFSKIVSAWESKWNVPRYVWKMLYDRDLWELKLTVQLELVPKNSDLWNLGWTSNLVTVETDILATPYPHVIKSRWAWLWVTAGAVRAWIANMLPQWLPRR